MKRFALLSAVALLVASCAVTPEQAAEREAREAAFQAELDAGRGESVSRICFTRSIDSYRALDDDNLLLRSGVNEWHLLELAGSCRPDWAFNAIGVQTRGASSCLSRGDAIITEDNGLGGRCLISRIYEWDEDAADAYRESVAAE